MSDQDQPKPTMRLADVARLFSCHRATIWRWVREGRFPKPVKLGPGVTAFFTEDVVAYQQQQTELGKPSDVDTSSWTDEDRELWQHDPFLPPMSALVSLCYMWSTIDNWDEFRAELSEMRRKLLVELEAETVLRDIAALLASPTAEPTNPD